MRGFDLKVAWKLFGWDGIKTWFSWSFVHPMQQFIWLNITHRPYCTYHGWHCNEKEKSTGKCEHQKLYTKQEIVAYWEEQKKELDIIEKGKDGLCTYCSEEKGEVLIDNPNSDSLSRWLVCKSCDEAIQYQKQLTFGIHVNNKELIEEANNNLYRISQETGKPILNVTVDKKQGVSSVEFTGEK